MEHWDTSEVPTGWNPPWWFSNQPRTVAHGFDKSVRPLSSAFAYHDVTYAYSPGICYAAFTNQTSCWLVLLCLIFCTVERIKRMTSM